MQKGSQRSSFLTVRSTYEKYPDFELNILKFSGSFGYNHDARHPSICQCENRKYLNEVEKTIVIVKLFIKFDINQYIKVCQDTSDTFVLREFLLVGMYFA